VSSYAESLSYLYGLQHRGMKLGLTNITRLLEFVGNPHTSFPSIHIAGTNGKGSTAAFTASMLTQAGFRTGLYTSPHLVRFTERVRIDGKEMPQRRLVKHVRTLRPMIEKLRATFFEATTCIAFLYFAEEDVRLAVIETGLGGRLDSTNIITPIVSVITNVAREHTEYLGTSLKSIAWEKAGIIKVGLPCVTAVTDAGSLSVLRRVALLKHAPLHRAQRIVRVTAASDDDHVVFSHNRKLRIRSRLGLHGRYQLNNARLALATITLMIEAGELPASRFSRTTIERGLRNVQRNTGIRGRMEMIAGRFLLDVAHNPAGMNTLVDTLRHGSRIVAAAVFGVMRDKNMSEMVRALRRVTRTVIAVTPGIDRARTQAEIADECRRQGLSVLPAFSVAEGISLALRTTPKKGIILITGSHYVVGEALSWLARKKLDNIA